MFLIYERGKNGNGFGLHVQQNDGEIEIDGFDVD